MRHLEIYNLVQQYSLIDPAFANQMNVPFYNGKGKLTICLDVDRKQIPDFYLWNK